MSWLKMILGEESAPPAARETPQAQRTGGGSVRTTLTQACSQHATATVIQPDAGQVRQARFASITEADVNLDLLDAASCVFQPLSYCLVTFYRGGRAFVMITPVRQFDMGADSGRPMLTLAIPSEVYGTDMRRSVRIPVMPSTGCTAQITDAGSRVTPARPMDASFGGLQLEVEADKDPGLQVSDAVQVVLNLKSTQCTLNAQVRRKEGLSYGLMFPDHYRGEDFEVPEAYRRMMLDLERVWLQERVK